MQMRCHNLRLFKIAEEDEYDPVGMMAAKTSVSGATGESALLEARAQAKVEVSRGSIQEEWVPLLPGEDDMKDIEYEMTEELEVGQTLLLKYGPRKGKSYTTVLTNHPEYVMDQVDKFHGKKMPKYVQEFLAWADKVAPKSNKSWGLKKKQQRKPAKAPHSCSDGCKEFSRVRFVRKSLVCELQLHTCQ